MKKNQLNIMKLSALLLLSLLLSFTVLGKDNSTQNQDAVIKGEVKTFFGKYLNTYNERFGYPEKADVFIGALSKLIHSPFVMAPPSGKAFYPNNTDLLKRSFDGFVQQLEKKGVTKLVWESQNYTVLTNNKVLVNNKGLGLNKMEETVYETQSIYLVVKSENGWQIALFNPYDINRKLDIKLK